MANSLSELFRGQPAPQQDVRSVIAQLRANPASALQAAGMRIPQGMNNPNQILNYLLQSGQVPQGRLAQAIQAAQQFRR